MFKRVRIEHLTWRKNQGFDVWFLFLRSERGLFAIAKQQVLADSGEHLRRDVEERGDGVEREMLYDAGAATEQLVVTLMGRGTVEVLITGLELVEHVLADISAKFHVLDASVEELHQFLAADPPHTAGHHSLDGGQRRLTGQDTRIVGHELALEREPGEVIAPVADAPRHVLEAPALHVGEPTCRVALALQLLALAVFHHLALLPAELPKRPQVNAPVCFLEFLFHRDWRLFLFLLQYFLLYAGQRGYEILEANFAHTFIECTAQLIDFCL